MSFQSWKLKYSLELPVYLIEKGKKSHMIDMYEIKINDECMEIAVIREGFYNKKKGVIFTEFEDIFI